jgi:predicted acyltransferase
MIKSDKKVELARLPALRANQVMRSSEIILICFKSTTSDPKAAPGAVIAIQAFGDFLGFNPHLHILISDGCFHENGLFTVVPTIDVKVLKQIFRHKVLKMFIRRRALLKLAKNSKTRTKNRFK